MTFPEKQKEVADALALAIKAAGMRQRDVAALLQCSESAISERLSGKLNLTLVSIYNICEATGHTFTIRISKKRKTK